jgi:hypothetical protein
MIFGISDSVIAVRVLAWLGIVLGVIMGWFGLQQMSRKGPTLIINESGIDDKRLGVGQIPWTAISAVLACKAPLRNKSVIELWLSDESTYVSRMPRRMRMVAPTLKANGHSPFLMSMTFLNPGFGPVYEYIRKRLDNHVLPFGSITRHRRVQASAEVGDEERGHDGVAAKVAGAL